MKENWEEYGKWRHGKQREEILKQHKMNGLHNQFAGFDLPEEMKQMYRAGFQPFGPKNIAKFATKRNKLRRRGYTALRKFINEFPFGLVGAFVFKKQEEDVLILENEIKNILNKIN